MNIKGCQIKEMQTPNKSTQLNFSALTDNSNNHNLPNKVILVNYTGGTALSFLSQHYSTTN